MPRRPQLPAGGIRDALMVALRYDRNAGVREKALEGLEPYVAEDMRVRNAVLEALLNDSDPRIRTESINILEPVEGDTSVRQCSIRCLLRTTVPRSGTFPGRS